MKQYLATVLLSLSLVNNTADAQTGTAPASSKNQKSTQMKTFSLLVRVPLSYTTEQARAVNPAWEQTIARWKAAGIYVTSFAFPGAGYVVAGAEKTVRSETVVCHDLKVVSNIVLIATNIEAALEQAKACPVLAYGGTVEVREIPRGLSVVEKQQ